MQSTNPPRAPRRHTFSLLATVIGMLGFMSSFTLAVHMLLMDGNPGFLFIWLLAAAATLVSMRFDRRWRAAMERISTLRARELINPLQRKWNDDVEDVVFRDLPSAAQTSIQ
ncbi:MAG TPA: hypothetical protein VJ698_10770 [Noviherbaspirillum sp.]|uniref:hypothetical protein n=1 Tax=Noviherbaspirillum sp. TaxID=1926288 RepID=UPI002B4A1501|nr:hypothetical protein [Noviherbaspirillum sp.]HJV85948.1 hypothetical protein [Noviherbaspirillum sp.]